MTVASRLITVGATPTLLNNDTTPEGVSVANSLLVKNPNAAVVYIGGADVTADSVPATGGYPLAQNEVMAIATEAEKVYGRVASGTAVVNVLLQGLYP